MSAQSGRGTHVAVFADSRGVSRCMVLGQDRRRVRKAWPPAKAIDLPGQGEDQTPLKLVTLDTMVDRIIETLKGFAEPSVLVGHSLGGIPISVAGEKAPDRVKTLVYLSAFLPRDGETLIDIENRNPKQVVPKSMIFDSERISGAIMLDKVREIFYHDCSEADVAFATERLRPQAVAALFTPVHLTPGAVRSHSAESISNVPTIGHCR